MAYEQKDMTGALFPNDKGGVETRPDHKGRVLIGGKLYWLSAWQKQGKNGPYFSLSIQAATDAPKAKIGKPEAPVNDFVDDPDIPF